MHLLVAQPGEVQDGNEAVDLDQPPGDVIFLSAAASDLAVVAAAKARLDDGGPSLRLANLMQLEHNMSVDLYVEKTISRARLVVIRLLGGSRYWSYGIEQVAAACRGNGILLAVVPGDDQPDPELNEFATLPPEAVHRIWQYFSQGGGVNAENFLNYTASLLGAETEWQELVPLLRAGIYWPGLAQPGLAALQQMWPTPQPVAAIVFYRALVQSEDLKPIDALIGSMMDQGLNPLPIFVASLKDEVAGGLVRELLAETAAEIVLNLTGFAVSTPGQNTAVTPFTPSDCPVLQVALSGDGEQAWRAGSQGMTPRNLAMNIALPEVDGRIISRAISFKTAENFDEVTQSAVVRHAPVADRVDFVASLATAWVRLRRTAAAERRIAVVVANYPNKDGRLGNGVGLDTPAGVAEFFARLRDAGYALSDDTPATGAAVAERLLAGPTNAHELRDGGVVYADRDYAEYFAALPSEVQCEVTERWGDPSADPFHTGDGLLLPVHRFGNVVLAVQPSRGYDVDPLATYHDPALVPPHRYLAFYGWLRRQFDAHAVVHFGKHGNLEWLPGKAVALSEDCYPDAVFGPLPHLYPFIVNDPGEGTQAKRRSQAVIVDHLMPPLTRAESYGPLRDLEQLVDEYYQAAGMDPKRLDLLGRQILSLSREIGLDRDVGIGGDDVEIDALAKIDNYLCELKEMQIRDGLHIFGQAPDGGRLTDLLVALTRVPRGDGKAENASLLRALAADLGMAGFDPLDCVMGDPWTGPRPGCLDGEAPWRTYGDTVERLEFLAQALVAGRRAPDPSWEITIVVLDFVEHQLRPTIADCGEHETGGLLAGLDGRFVPPGASGAPSRGRLDVLPTGRNFYSVDIRAIPTPAAWQLGWKSAALLLDRHFQEHGEYPRRIALSAWGTANMRTGGDDIAQALALMGAQPVWDQQARRVTGFEIMPAEVLDRPRVDVVFRVSGFFRDAFPFQLDLVASAARAVAALDEPEDINPLAAQFTRDRAAFAAAGLSDEEAGERAGFRVFGSKPGAYGAGLQTLIDERCWVTDEDLARAYVAWGGFAYGGGRDGVAVPELFEARLKNVEVVVHNQDNREHDILDSDDYYQFEGGITAAVRHFSGAQPAIYHNDHSRPELPRIRTLRDEIGRVVRARAANPKWIEGVMRHGYKGAFEIAATVDYLFAFAATARVVEDHHFEMLYDAYLVDERVREFVRANNAPALIEIAARFEEAIARGFWHPHSNSVGTMLQELMGEPSHV